MDTKLLVGLTMVLLGSIAIYEYGSLRPTAQVEITPGHLTIGASHPPLWLFYNTSEVNARHWLDFGARSSYAINIPLLNMLYERIVMLNGRTYTVRVLNGLESVAELFGGWEHLPSRLQKPKARVYVAEEDWIRTAILAKFGGLWMSPYVVALRPIGELPKSITVFGQDADSGFSCFWVPEPNNPSLIAWEKRIRERLETQVGGFQIRGDAMSDLKEIAQNQLPGELVFRPMDELSRNERTNKKLELEDIFASGTGGRLTFTIPAEAKYLVIPYQDLLERSSWAWVLRMSEEQILSSDLALSHILARRVNQR